MGRTDLTFYSKWLSNSCKRIQGPKNKEVRPPQYENEEVRPPHDENEEVRPPREKIRRSVRKNNFFFFCRKIFLGSNLTTTRPQTPNGPPNERQKFFEKRKKIFHFF